ncbi:hypothetical protein HHL11_02985 [Ramlibacter sp. G-1-2-2]|uniref:Glycosyltransferase RgtA/B/C/D-like domain-containing protein n=1 Tax=Ramlibacter agri TaxID=2728837 RepID=A0A848H0S1_9BURK|nr:hypothetical protein [Ramlibacter agri]NML42700.1 hypothetical protein [Ramlibacter agri]
MNAAVLRGMRAPGPGAELALTFAIVWIALASIPVALGGIGLSWDALNHHIYLGWTAEHPRFDRDFLAASYQGYQYPYLYWPAWKLFQHNVPGSIAGVVIVTLHLVALPALWLIARSCIPGRSWYATAMRITAVALGFSGELFLSLLDTTTNDGLVSVPFVWAVAVALLAAQPQEERPSWLTAARAVALSGLLAGISVAFKLSNGPLALLLPLLWLLAGARWPGRVVQAIHGGIWTLFGFALALAPWGFQLWKAFGNPFYPFFEPQFAALRASLGLVP